MNNHPKCPFQNRYMQKPCDKHLFKNHNEWFCAYHGTMTFEREAWDKVETPPDTYEAENGGLSWSQDEVNQLLELDEQGVTIADIARVLGRTKNAVYNKLWSEKGKIS